MTKRMAKFGNEIGAAIEAIIGRESITEPVAICELAEQVVVNGASLLLTGFLGKHKPGLITGVVHAGLEAMIAEIQKIRATELN